MGETTVDCAHREVCYGEDQRVPLSEMEADILLRLAGHAGRAVSREELLSSVWGLRDGTIETRAIDMHITRLRQKLSKGSTRPIREWIVTVRGKGYMLGPDVEVDTEDSTAEGTKRSGSKRSGSGQKPGCRWMM